MAIRQIRIGGSKDVLQYDDGDFDCAIETDHRVKVGTAPVDPEDVLRLNDVGGAGGTGDVIGPGASVDSTIPLWDGATGKLLKQSEVIIDGTDKIFPAAARVGGAVNYLDIDTSGIVTLHGAAERTLVLRPGLDYTAQLAHAKPTQVTVGIFKGFSFPIYAADNEELFFRERVPGRWNGSSDILFCIGVCLSAVEDVGDYFKFRLSWEHTAIGEEVPITSNDVDVEQIVLIGRSAQYDLYKLDFIIDYDIDGVGNEITAGELLAGRIYRIDATNPDITNEAILLNWATVYEVDKMFRAP